MDTEDETVEECRQGLRVLGDRYVQYTSQLTAAADLRPSHDEIALAVHKAIVVHGVKVTEVAADLQMNRVQMDRDYGWAWRPCAHRPKWAQDFDVSGFPGWADGV